MKNIILIFCYFRFQMQITEFVLNFRATNEFLAQTPATPSLNILGI